MASMASNEPPQVDADPSAGALGKPTAGKVKTERDLIFAVATSMTTD